MKRPWHRLPAFLTKRRRVWTLDQQARRYGQRPSALVGIEHDLLAWLFDEAVAWVGQMVEGHLAARDPITGEALYRVESVLGE